MRIADSNQFPPDPAGLDVEELSEKVTYDFGVSRRDFVQLFGAGLLFVVSAGSSFAQRSGGNRGERTRNVEARVHISREGVISVLAGKTEMGQGARAELTQAAAEELFVPASQIQMILSDTALVPDDGLTAGSRTTPSTVPAVRRATAAARQFLVQMACEQWKVEASAVDVRDGKITHAASHRSISFAELAQSEELAKALSQPIPDEIVVVPIKEWKILGTSVLRPNSRDLASGAHRFPSDITRPGMLYGKVLRPPSFGATLVSVDLEPARAMPGVLVFQDGQFVGVAAPTSFAATQALASVTKSAKWDSASHPSSKDLFDYLRAQAQGGVAANPFAAEVAAAHRSLRQTYHVAYAQHAPMETRVALAEWSEGKLTVWTGTQNPFGYQSDLARALRVPGEAVRVIVPDFGGGFGGKHTAEAAVEAARLARAVGRPVLLKWTREEEFTWAYFRPAAVVDLEASLDEKGALTSWYCLNINSGNSAVNTPYRAGHTHASSVSSKAPLRHGSYRALAATANNFARESFMDELAFAAGADPLDFRLAHLGSTGENGRLRAVLEEAAKRFKWRDRVKKKQKNIGVGLACGTEKGSYVAACAEIAFEREEGKIIVRRVCEVFECGAILNPDNLLAQVQGAIVMGLGPALREEVRFEDGKMQNPRFSKYQVPRFSDVPELDIHLLNRPDLPSSGGGETPLIAVAPAIANALFQASAVRVREMPIRFPRSKPA